MLANRGGQRTTDLNTPLVAVPSPAGDRDRPGPGMLAWSFAENQRGEITTNAGGQRGRRGRQARPGLSGRAGRPPRTRAGP